MKTETFQKGMALISEAFPKLEFNTKLYWRMLADIKDRDFEDAIVCIIQELTELYPNSNLIAIIRQKAHEAPAKRIARIVDQCHGKIPYEDCAPPPKEWTELVASVAKSKEIDRKDING